VTKPQRGLFVVTILSGSFLLFMVQPLVARMALPRLGGAPAVWNSAMLVYQALLLGGYAYAHALGRLTLRRQAMVHLAVLVLAGLTLPIGLAELPPLRSGWEPVWVPLLFLATIGPVFFAVSAQAPLIQRWYGADPAAGDPYWLYAASNLGSFAGLIAYPLLVEPNLPLAEQSLGWSLGYGALAALVAVTALSRWRTEGAVTTGTEAQAGTAQPIGARRIFYWLALAAVPSGLMLSTTTHLTTDIVAMPLLWVIPLGLYLLSFVFAFNERSHLGQVFTRVAPFTLALAGGFAMASRGTDGVTVAGAAVLMLLIVAVALHRRLYRDRPDPSQLTLFYLVMSAGGALGGLFTALIAPVAFDWVWEHPLLVLAAAALLADRPMIDWTGRLGIPPRYRRAALLAVLLAIAVLAGTLYQALLDQSSLTVAALMVAVAVLSMLLLGNRLAFTAAILALMLGRGGYETLESSLDGSRQRSFFGVYAVRESEYDGLRGLTHGTTLHGLQFADRQREQEPTSYYTRSSGVGMALEQADRIVGAGARVGVVGLGVGTLACYRRPDQSYEFFEIDPTVASYSKDGTFTFLARCAPHAPIHFGDARLELAAARPAHFDMLVIDAFSSDSIPVHLMTREAFAVYRRALTPGGVLLVHISNRYIDLEPVVAALAAESGLHARQRVDLDKGDAGRTPSLWVALSADPEALDRLEAASPPRAWEALAPVHSRARTDDFASILPFLRWDKVLGRGS
jgi:SAM-dependent methyltransferase